MSPSLIPYSCSSLLSARTFPLSKRRWTSAGGAPDSEASCALIVAMVSVGCIESVYDCTGLVDLNVMLIEARRVW